MNEPNLSELAAQLAEHSAELECIYGMPACCRNPRRIDDLQRAIKDILRQLDAGPLRSEK